MEMIGNQIPLNIDCADKKPEYWHPGICECEHKASLHINGKLMCTDPTCVSCVGYKPKRR